MTMTTDQIIQKSTPPRPPASGPLRITFLGQLAYLVLFAATLVLAATGVFWAWLVQGKPMHGWVLMIHAAFAPVFAVALAVVSLTWADRARFACRRSLQRASARVLFWVLLLLGLTMILSGVLPMTPIFGTDGQVALYLTHRYCGMAIAVVIVLHLLSLIRVR